MAMQVGRRRSSRTLAVAAMLVTLSGCAVGPDFKRPAAPQNAAYSPTPLPTSTVSAGVHGGEAQRFALGRDVAFDWWKQFNSPELNALVEQAFNANPTIEAALASLEQAQELVSAQQGFFFPTLGVGYQYQQQQLAGNLSGSSAPGVQGNGTAITAT